MGGMCDKLIASKLWVKIENYIVNKFRSLMKNLVMVECIYRSCLGNPPQNQPYPVSVIWPGVPMEWDRNIKKLFSPSIQ